MVSSYIAPLDGLRALAVTLVLIFHVLPDVLKGGFIGVDVFFVISGFIISRGILKSLENGDFSYVAFIKRRFARLVPALLATIAFTSAAVLLLQSPRQLVDYAQSAIFGLFSVSNIFFYFNSDYFDGAAATKPLLHTWSLGVEEQFYLVWPLLLWALFRVGGRSWLIGGVAVATVASLVASHVVSARDASAVFYLTPFRVYQLGLGALVGTLHWTVSRRVATAITLVGIGGILAVALLATGTGHYALEGVAPSVAACLFLLGMRSPVARFGFGNAAATAIGRRAYSIYLAHWPLIVLCSPYLQWWNPWARAALLLAASLALGDILHRAVETPLRLSHGAEPARKRENVLWGTSMAQAALVAICAVFWGADGFVARYGQEVVKVAQFAQLERNDVATVAEFGRCTLSDSMPASAFDPNSCMSTISGRPNFAVLGDSFGIETIVGLRDVFGDRVHFGHASYAGCAPMSGPSTEQARPECRLFNAARLERLKSLDVDAVVLTGNWHQVHAEGLAQLIRDLRGAGKRVIVVGVRAAFTQNVPDILVQAGSVADANLVLRGYLLPGRAELDQHFEAITANAGGEYIHVLGTQCSEELCPAATPADRLIYFDFAHLTRAGGRLLADVIAPALFHGARS